MDGKTKKSWENFRAKAKAPFANMKIGKKTSDKKLRGKPLAHRRSISVPDLRILPSQPSPSDGALPSTTSKARFFVRSGESDTDSVNSGRSVTDGLTETDSAPPVRYSAPDSPFRRQEPGDRHSTAPEPTAFWEDEEEEQGEEEAISMFKRSVQTPLESLSKDVDGSKASDPPSGQAAPERVPSPKLPIAARGVRSSPEPQPSPPIEIWAGSAHKPPSSGDSVWSSREHAHFLREKLASSGERGRLRSESRTPPPSSRVIRKTASDRLSVPVDRQTTPVDRLVLQVDRQTTPIDRLVLQVDRQTTPADRLAQEADRQTTPADRLSMQADWQTTPADRPALQADRQTTPVNRLAQQVDRQTSVGSADGDSVCGSPLEEQTFSFWATDPEDQETTDPLSSDITEMLRMDAQDEMEEGPEQSDQYEPPALEQAGDSDTAGEAVPVALQRYLLTINLKEGRNLFIRDRSGSTDPYVKFKLGGKMLYKSKVVRKSRNPRWSESFSFPLRDKEHSVEVRVYDRNLTSDVFMGSSTLRLDNMELDRTCEMELVLDDPKCKVDKGVVVMETCLTLRDATIKRNPRWLPKRRRSFRGGQSNLTQIKEQRPAEVQVRSQLWSGAFGVRLVEGQDMPHQGYGDIYVRFRLGEQKYRSKNLCIQANPQWREQFDFNKYEEVLEPLQVEVLAKRGRKCEECWGIFDIDLTRLSVEEKQLYTRMLDPGKGLLVLLVTLAPCCGVSVASSAVCPLDQPDERDLTLERYSLRNTHKSVREVGFLQVQVLKASDVPSADLNGKSDPFCVVELGNCRLQTQTIHKTLNPEWNQVFTFPIKDIHEVLELTVFDENTDKSTSFLGKVAIPLLSIQSGQQVSCLLKKEDLGRPAKGSITLVLDVIYNPIRAGIKTFKPKETKFLEESPKFSKKVLAQNIYRVRKISTAVLYTLQYIKSCFQWESTQRSIIAFLMFVLTVWHWELFMLPLFLVLLIAWNYFQITTGKISSNQDLVNMTMADEEEEDEKESGKKGLMDKIHMVHEIVITVQNILDEIASVGERIKNTFNWSVPFLSCLACLVLLVATAVLYYIPLRYIVLTWGVNKFTKKLRSPYAIDNNEILDFLKRMPSDVQKVQYSELRPPGVQSPARRRR